MQNWVISLLVPILNFFAFTIVIFKKKMTEECVKAGNVS